MKKFNWNNYFQPTPKLFRQLGDSLLVASTFGMGIAFFSESYTIMLVLGIVSVVAKFATNFFKK
jgi:hypothetical protein